ncbi:GcrA family cell cycle regulator [Sphingosinicella sp. BN140058]|uniref:GcrA family cell cycle regulator n=1 Tax=Sphingosinicella sp. BN140058 TaxID=1892855 RepID=UPI001012582B|nr:GcrA family cell cycle regulator [Sphingosinicella sp. BN140058]QAY79612.1 GcrA cell cycle regulator [Sphingosinicella sp. BN140058]
MSWTDERIERLKELWTQGNTASQIADELGGVSRNAVIGKAHRLGLQSRPSPVKANEPAAAAQPAREPEAQPDAAPAQAAAPATPPPAAAAAPAPWDDEPRAAPAPRAQPAQPAAPAAPASAPAADAAPQPIIRSIGPGGFLRQTPGEQQSPIPPAPPRRLVPAKPSPDIADKTSLLDLNEKVCKWPVGHPGEPDFHFCGAPSNPGFPYCVQHCGVAYQAQLPRRDRRPPPPLPFGGPRIR